MYALCIWYLHFCRIIVKQSKTWYGNPFKTWYGKPFKIWYRNSFKTWYGNPFSPLLPVEPVLFMTPHDWKMLSAHGGEWCLNVFVTVCKNAPQSTRSVNCQIGADAANDLKQKSISLDQMSTNFIINKIYLYSEWVIELFWWWCSICMFLIVFILFNILCTSI